MAYDTVTKTYSLTRVDPQFFPHLQTRLNPALVASTVYPAGSILGELTGTPGTFGLTITISNMALTSNVVTVTTKGLHGLSVGDTVAVTAVTATTANGTGLAVLSVPSTTTFTYAKTASNITSAADTGTVVRNAGTSTPKAVLAVAYATDASGVIYLGSQASSDNGSTVNGATATFTGVYKQSELANFDAVVLAAWTGARVISGSVASGTALVEIG